jgi:hypothetical protein
MKSTFFGSVVAAGVVIGCLGCGNNVPAHPTCAVDTDCTSPDRCHIPDGDSTGVCVEVCSTAGSCPSSEPQCVPEDNQSSPFSFCACEGEYLLEPDGGGPLVSTGCGANNGYGCSVELQVCLPR